MIKKNDVVQFTENHKWVGCFGYVTRVKGYGGGLVRYMIAVPLPMQGTAYIFDDGSGIEKVGTAVLVPAEDEEEDGEKETNCSEFPNNSDVISRQQAIDAVDSETVSTNPEHFKSSEKFIKFMDDADIASFGKWQWANGFNTGLVASRIQLKKLPSAEPERKTGRWSGLWSEPQDDNSIYGEKLMEGDTIYLLGVEGTVRQECGAWGWASGEYVPWEKLEEKMPHGNSPDFCYCDNFVSFWELKWAFDDGYDWDGVPFITHGARMEEE